MQKAPRKNFQVQWESYLLFCTYFHLISRPTCTETLQLFAQFQSRTFKSTDSSRNYMDRVKRIWYLSPMRAAKVQASLRIRAVSPEPPLLAHTSSESRGTFRQKARSLAPLNGLACAVEICHDRMLEDTNSLDGAHINGVKFMHLLLCYVVEPEAYNYSRE